MSNITEPDVPTPEPEVKKKKRVNSKAKGSGFEGHISKVLAEALPPMKFRRSQSSGAILGGLNARFMDQFSDDAKALFIGDVVPTNEADVFRDEKWKVKFTVECKFYRDIENLEHLLDKTKILGWYDEAVKDAAKIGKQPLLIFKFNHSIKFCAIDVKYGLPSTIKGTVTLTRAGDVPINVAIFSMDEALLDVEWWKQR